MMQTQYSENSDTELALQKLENAVREHARTIQRRENDDQQPIQESEAIQ